MNNYILEYYQAITSGEIVAGEYIKKWYSRIVRGLENKEFFYSAKKAGNAIKFIESFCHHHEGELAPNLLKLELWQKSFLSVIFGIVDDEGVRFFREVFLQIGRKNGKTLLAAGIAEYMTFLDDYGARIYFAAPKLDQARLCYEAYYQSIKMEPDLDNLAKKRRTDVYVEARNASAAPLAFSAKKSDGLNVSLCIADEVAAWSGEEGLRFYQVIKSSVGARKAPMILSISTANFINDSIFDDLMKRSTAVINGTSKEKRLAPFLYVIDDVTKWNDINELQKSNPNLGVSVSVDYMLEEINIAEGSLSKKAEFLTKYCNIKQNASIAWLTAEDIKRCCGEPITLEGMRENYAVAGIDLSQTTDLTSACVIIEKDEKLHVISHFWLPEEKIETAIAADGLPYREYIAKGWLSLSGQNYIDYNDIFEWFRMLIEEYEIYSLYVGYDRYSSQYLIKDMQGFGYKCDDVFQGYNLTTCIQTFEGLVKDGQINIGDNDLLKIHMLDTALKMDTESRRTKIIKVHQRAHIDGVAAILCALCMRSKYYESIGEQLTNKE